MKIIKLSKKKIKIYKVLKYRKLKDIEVKAFSL